MDKITTGKYEQTPKVSLFQDVFQPKFEWVWMSQLKKNTDTIEFSKMV